MGDYGTSGEPAEELQNLLATGAVGGALQQYITATLGEAQAALRSADAPCMWSPSQIGWLLRLACR